MGLRRAESGPALRPGVRIGREALYRELATQVRDSPRPMLLNIGNPFTLGVLAAGPGLADPPDVLSLYLINPSRRVRRQLT